MGHPLLDNLCKRHKAAQGHEAQMCARCSFKERVKLSKGHALVFNSLLVVFNSL